MRHKIVELDSVGNADREALCQYPSRPIVAHKVFSNFNNQMVFGSHQSQKGDEIISIHPNLKPLKAHRGGIFTIMSTVHEGMHETPEQNSSGKGGGKFGKPNPKPRDGSFTKPEADGSLVPNPKPEHNTLQPTRTFLLS